MREFHVRHFWSRRPPPAGANVWVDRIERWRGRSVAWGKFSPSHFNLVYVQSGAGLLCRESDESFLPDGTMTRFWANRDVRLSAAPGQTAEFVRMRLRGINLPDYLAAFGLSAEVPAVSCRDSGGVERILDRLYAMLARRVERNACEAMSLIYALPAACASPGHNPRNNAGLGADLVDEALSLMEADLADPLTVSEMARAVNVSESTMLRLFREHHGKTPSEVLMAIRIRHARELLVRTDLKIAAVARACGFRNEKYFYRRFKSVMGETPARHRRNNRLERTDKSGSA